MPSKITSLHLAVPDNVAGEVMDLALKEPDLLPRNWPSPLPSSGGIFYRKLGSPSFEGS